MEGLDGESPLGRIVGIRAENNPERLKEFTPEEKRIRNEYRQKIAKKKSGKEVVNAIDMFKRAFVALADEKVKV